MSLPNFPMPSGLPKLSDFTAQMLRQPEAQIESMLKQSVNVALPKGPTASVLQLQRSLENGGGGGGGGGFPAMPMLPDLPFGGTSAKQTPFGSIFQGGFPKIPELPKGAPELPFGQASQTQGKTSPAAKASTGKRSVHPSGAVIAAGRGRDRNAEALF